ncbi:MAG TPA: SDR family oxidoreductase [Stellaceae bacterium]|nr:SDR family oxidoreductase [Stellaceae bacterium]
MPPYLANFSLEGKTALVTGAGRGLGFEIAKAMAGAGAHVVVNGRDRSRLDAACRSVGEAGGSASPAAFDIADAEALRSALDAIERERGRLDIVVGNVGQRDRRRLAECSDDDLRCLISVDLVASLILAREAAERMLPRGGGRLIFVTSIASIMSSGRDASYAAAKAGLEGMIHALATEYGPNGITANGISPGFFATETNAALAQDPKRSAYFERRTPLGRWGRPEEIAGAAVFLASAAASFVNGHILVVDGGTTSKM